MFNLEEACKLAISDPIVKKNKRRNFNVIANYGMDWMQKTVSKHNTLAEARQACKDDEVIIEFITPYVTTRHSRN